MTDAVLDYHLYPDANGHFGRYGGRFVAETLIGPLQELGNVINVYRETEASMEKLREILGDEDLGADLLAEGRALLAVAQGHLQRGLALEMRPHGLHLGVEVVEVVQQDGLTEHGELRRAELVLAVMTDDEVLDQSLQFAGKVRNLRNFGVHHFQLDHHVSKQLAAGGVREGTVVR